MKNLGKGGIEVILLILLTIGAFVFVGGFSPVKTTPPPEESSNVTIQDISPSAAARSLQLNALSAITSTPTPTPQPGPVCSVDDAVCHPLSLSAQVCCRGNFPLYCSKGKCVNGPGQTNACSTEAVSSYKLDGVCVSACGAKDGYTCYGKPVIYLYPKAKMNVDVAIETRGKIVVSNPFYPPDGWKNVTAYPNGTLIYNNQTYKELFYESQVPNISQPNEGIIIPTSKLRADLGNILYQMGLDSSEKEEFLDFWIPRLNALKSNFILFSLVDKNTKELNDHVVINPVPDTRIEFIAYFKPLNFPISVKPLGLGPRPQRHGFTMVEWGGTIDSSSFGYLLQ